MFAPTDDHLSLWTSWIVWLLSRAWITTRCWEFPCHWSLLSLALLWPKTSPPRILFIPALRDCVWWLLLLS